MTTSPRRAVVFTNHKGGVGKTSVSTNVAAEAARAGWRVLLIDLDKQGSAGWDLGYRHDDSTDHGQALLDMITNGDQLRPILADVRPNLDVIPGGQKLTELDLWLMSQVMKGVPPAGMLRPLLTDALNNYDLVIMDTNPGVESVMQTALGAAHWVVIPTQPDWNSIDGLSELAGKVAQARTTSPDVRVLGSVLFDIPANAHQIRKRADDDVTEMLGEEAETFKTRVRSAKKIATLARERGQVAYELATDAANAPAWHSILAKHTLAGAEGANTEESAQGVAPEEDVEYAPKSATGVADDYEQLTSEIIRRIIAREDATEDAAS
ncbi:MAG: ParA family protein [Nocardioides sp.]|nr:ParA family protein [Nocardioides sp.]